MHLRSWDWYLNLSHAVSIALSKDTKATQVAHTLPVCSQSTGIISTATQQRAF